MVLTLASGLVLVGCAVFVVLSWSGTRLHKVAAVAVIVAVPLQALLFDRWVDEGCFEGYEDCGALDLVWLGPVLFCLVALLGFWMFVRRRLKRGSQ